jgi:threonine/homoserine/homoserine lactone efflux protein
VPPIGKVLAFAVTAVVIVAIPGPSVLFTIGRALTVGRRGALLTVVGNTVGVGLQVVAVALGMGVLVERSSLLFTGVKYAGAAYIVYLGVQAVRHRGSMAEALARRAAPVTPGRAVRDGFVVGFTNPKTIVILVTVMPGFAAPALGHLPLQLLLLGSLFPAAGLLLDSGWAFAAGTARAWFARSPRRLALIGGSGGLVMIGLGLNVALTGRRD